MRKFPNVCLKDFLCFVEDYLGNIRDKEGRFDDSDVFLDRFDGD